jgi:hypothetical protein
MKKLFILILVIFTCSIHYAQKEQLLSLKNNLLVNYESESNLLVNSNNEKKSAALAIVYSVLLPGMGELYVGNYSTGQYFTIADGVIWGFFTGFTIYGNNKENDYRSFAKSYGSVNVNGKDGEYFANISLYQNIDEFNLKVN